MKEQDLIEDVPSVGWFENLYDCSRCGTTWTDEWSCTCNDRCPNCNAEIEPTSSLDLSEPLTEQDYLGAWRLLSVQYKLTREQITEQDARDYAMAMLEGGEDRFDSSRRHGWVCVTNS